MLSLFGRLFRTKSTIVKRQMSSKEKLQSLRSLMSKEGITCYVVPSGDAHQSEYTPEQDKRRQFITNFTGSAGLAVVGPTSGWLWTDGRYWNQASLELSEEWHLMKMGLPETPSPEQFIATNFPAGTVTGVDPSLLGISTAQDYVKTLNQVNQSLKYIPQNLVDLVWKDKPATEIHKCIVLGDQYTGRSVDDKLSWLRKELTKNNMDFIVITALDEIAWLFNIRGFDIPYNPVLISYSIISQTEAKIYLNKNKISDEILSHFKKYSVIALDYESFFTDLEKIRSTDRSVWVDTNSSIAVYNSLHDGKSHSKVSVIKSPITLEKSLKTEKEIEGIRHCSIRDAVALVKFFSWLETELISKNNGDLSEWSVANKLLKFRQEQDGFINPSFATISSTGSNAAIIHYHPDEKHSAKILKNQIFLCDSGGQYKDGTTDVTRTFHFTTPTEKEKLTFTLVLKGVISLSNVVFPNNTTGLQVDAFARQALWQHGLDYRHGTGHGVGHFLNVHEGPHQISFRQRAFEAPLKANMTVTNEPGYYEDGAFGIRIENMMIVKNVHTTFNFQNTGFLGFDTITYVPIDYKLIDVSLLTSSEREWINKYHTTCFYLLSPFLENDKETLTWLKKYTNPI